jgi:hypothetical protein
LFIRRSRRSKEKRLGVSNSISVVARFGQNVYRNFGIHLFFPTQKIEEMDQKYESLSRDSSEAQGSELTESGIYPQDALNNSTTEQMLRRRLVFVIFVMSAVCAILTFRVFSLELQRHQKPINLSCEYSIFVPPQFQVP